MQEPTNPSVSGEPSTGAFTSHSRPRPTRLPTAFTLKGVSQVKAGITVLDGVEVDIPHGDIIALVGPSGAGKTSLLRLLNRLDDPVRGEILYRARPITDYPVQALRRHVGFVFQAPVMFPGTVRDNLQVALALSGDHEPEAEARMAEDMALAELDHALRKALEEFYPNLREMTLLDYKVRILDESRGTAAKTRVLVTSGDGEETWGTVGVAHNIIAASWQALVDSIEYKLRRDERRSLG